MTERLPVNGTAAQLEAGDAYGAFATLLRDCYWHAPIGAVDDARLARLLATFGRPWSPEHAVATVAPRSRPRFAADTREAIPAHNECAYTERPPRLLALYCVANDSDGGAFFAIPGERLVARLGERYLPSLRGARYACRMSDAAPAFETALLRPTPTGERLVYTAVAAMGGGSAYTLVRAADACSAELLTRVRGLVDDPSLRHRHRWRAGDLLVLDNLRLLHGREAFGAGERVLRHVRIA